MPWTEDEKYFVSLLIWRKKNHSKLQTKFAGNLTQQLSPEKPNLSSNKQIPSPRVSKQPQQKAENSRSGGNLTARCPDNEDWVRDSVGRSLKKSPSKDVTENLAFSVRRCKAS